MLPNNTLVSVPNLDAAIEEVLKIDPATAYPPHEDTTLPELVATFKSQPLISTRNAFDHQDFDIRLAYFDYGENPNMICYVICC